MHGHPGVSARLMHVACMTHMHLTTTAGWVFTARVCPHPPVQAPPAELAVTMATTSVGDHHQSSQSINFPIFWGPGPNPGHGYRVRVLVLAGLQRFQFMKHCETCRNASHEFHQDNRFWDAGPFVTPGGTCAAIQMVGFPVQSRSLGPVVSLVSLVCWRCPGSGRRCPGGLPARVVIWTAMTSWITGVNVKVLALSNTAKQDGAPRAPMPPGVMQAPPSTSIICS